MGEAQLEEHARLSRLAQERELPAPPTPPAPEECCGRHCEPCVWDWFERALTRYRQRHGLDEERAVEPDLVEDHGIHGFGGTFAVVERVRQLGRGCTFGQELSGERAGWRWRARAQVRSRCSLFCASGS